MDLKAFKLTSVWICVAASVLACLAQTFLTQFGGVQLLQRLEWMTHDWRLRVANKFNPPVSDQLGFVHIGDDAIAIFSQGALGTNLHFGLKWPRQVYGRALRELRAEGATGVGLDILFGDRRPDHAKVQGVDSDVFFAQQLRLAGNVVIGATKEVPPAPLFRATANALGDISQERDSDGVLRRARAFHDYRFWQQDIQREALLAGWDLAKASVQSNQIIFPTARGGQAVLNLNPDGYFDPTEVTGAKPPGGFVRLEKPFEEARVWHLGLALAARELGLDLEKAVVRLDKHQITLAGTNGLSRVIPVDDQGRFLIDWSLRLNDSRLVQEAFEELVSDDVRRTHGSNVTARFAGKLIIVGSTATGSDLTDRGATPLEKDTFLTINYCNVVNSMLTDRFIQPIPTWVALLLVGLMGCGASILTMRLPALWASLLVALLVAACVLLQLVLFIRYRWALPMVMPVGAALLSHFGLLTYQTFFEQNERRRIKSLFTKLVSPHIVNELLKAKKISLVGARGEVTVFFADIRGFTEMTDRSHAQAEAFVLANRYGEADAKVYFDQQAQVLLHTVNEYLGLIADVIKKHEGTLDKYIGDCVMAFWGAPTPNARHALACVRAAIDAQRAIHALNQQRTSQNKLRQAESLRRAATGHPPLPILDLLTLGTGINTGFVTVGVMGSAAHGLNYTVLGRDVNLASRLEGHSGQGRIVISEATYLELQRDAPTLASTCVPLPPPKLKGFGGAVMIFEVPWRPNLTGQTEIFSEPPVSELKSAGEPA